MEIDVINRRMFQNKEVSDETFKDCKLAKDLCFFNASLTNVTFENCEGESPDFRKAHLINCKFINCKFTRADFGLDCKLQDCEFRDCEFILMCGGTVSIINKVITDNCRMTYKEKDTKKLIETTLQEVWG